MSKIYVASSWRNKYYPEVVKALKEAGHEVYDFRNPAPRPPKGEDDAQGSKLKDQSEQGFKWQYVDPDYMNWTVEEYREQLNCEKARRQFKNDIEAMESCDTCVLVLPCGRSAHTEAGWFAGKGRKVIAYIPVYEEAELMYKLFDGIACNLEELIELLRTS